MSEIRFIRPPKGPHLSFDENWFVSKVRLPHPRSIAALRQSTTTANQIHAFRFLKDGLFTKLVELELDNRQISEVEILKIEKGEELDPPKKHEKRKSTFQVSHKFRFWLADFIISRINDFFRNYLQHLRRIENQSGGGKMIRKMDQAQPFRRIKIQDHLWKYMKKRNSWLDQYVIFTLGKIGSEVDKTV